MEIKQKLTPSNIKFSLIVMLLLSFGLVYATTQISTGTESLFDDGINASRGNVYVGNLFFGNTSGTFDYTAPNRPLIDLAPSDVTVCSSGCDYTTVQDAINDVPLILRFEYDIILLEQTNEDVYIPPTIVSGSHSSQGSIARLDLKGNISNMNQAGINSLHISGNVGASNPVIRYMQIKGEEPRSNENVSVAIYGTGTVIMEAINFTGNVDSAVMGYGTHMIDVDFSHFNGNQNVALRLKDGGVANLGDNGFDPNTGSVKQYLAKMDFGGKIIVADNNEISYPTASAPFLCEQNKGGEFIYKNKRYCGQALQIEGTNNNESQIEILSTDNENEREFFETHKFSNTNNITIANITSSTTGINKLLLIDLFELTGAVNCRYAFNVRAVSGNVGLISNYSLGQCSGNVILQASDQGNYVHINANGGPNTFFYTTLETQGASTINVNWIDL